MKKGAPAKRKTRYWHLMLRDTGTTSHEMEEEVRKTRTGRVDAHKARGAEDANDDEGEEPRRPDEEEHEHEEVGTKSQSETAHNADLARTTKAHVAQLRPTQVCGGDRIGCRRCSLRAPGRVGAKD
jgi:hypothetical protein